VQQQHRWLIPSRPAVLISSFDLNYLINDSALNVLRDAKIDALIPYLFSSVAYVWVRGAKTTVPIAKKSVFILNSNCYEQLYQVSPT
jgi:hypothetical protein